MTHRFWPDYRAIDWADNPTVWPWRYFSPVELASAGSAAKGDTWLLVDIHTATCLDALRGALGHSLTVTNVYRSPGHNANVGGADQSQHLLGRAADIPRSSIRNEAQFIDLGYRIGFRGFGFYDTFIHIDTGDQRWWDQRTGPRPRPPLPDDYA